MPYSNQINLINTDKEKEKTTRKIITRTITNYSYTCNVANINTRSFEEYKVLTTVPLKHPERQLAKKMPEGLTFISVAGEPEIIMNKLYMNLEDFIANAKPYEHLDGDEEA